MCKVIMLVLQFIFGTALAFLSFIDQKEKRVSLSSLIIMTLLSVLMVVIRVVSAEADNRIWILGDLGCGVAVGSLFLGISYVSSEKIGYGDSLMLLILGVGLGGWSLVCLLQVSAVCLMVSVIYMWKKTKIDRNTRIPFYPYLFLGYMAYLFDSLLLLV